MRIFFLTSILFYLLESCQSPIKEAIKESEKKTFVDSLKDLTEMVQVAFWFERPSKSQLLMTSAFEPVAIDSIINYIGREVGRDDCVSSTRRNYDGTFYFYHDSTRRSVIDYFEQLEFVLDSSCSYFIKGDVARNPRYFLMTPAAFKKLRTFQLGASHLLKK
jgi:hypothetical protein